MRSIIYQTLFWLYVGFCIKFPILLCDLSWEHFRDVDDISVPGLIILFLFMSMFFLPFIYKHIGKHTFVFKILDKLRDMKFAAVFITVLFSYWILFLSSFVRGIPFFIFVIYNLTIPLELIFNALFLTIFINATDKTGEVNKIVKYVCVVLLCLEIIFLGYCLNFYVPGLIRNILS